jgi:hypothetical protein
MALIGFGLIVIDGRVARRFGPAAAPP